MCFIRVLQGSIFRNTPFICIVVFEIVVFILSFVFLVLCVHSLQLSFGVFRGNSTYPLAIIED